MFEDNVTLGKNDTGVSTEYTILSFSSLSDLHVFGSSGWNYVGNYRTNFHFLRPFLGFDLSFYLTILWIKKNQPINI